MSRYVIPDTCALAAALYNEDHSASAIPLRKAILSRAVDVIAPSLCITEFLNVSRKKCSVNSSGSGVLSATDVETVVMEFLALPIIWIDVEPGTALNAWRLHQNHGLQTADAVFAEVALQWQAEI